MRPEEQAAIAAAAKAKVKAQEQQKQNMPLQAAATSSFSRLTAVGIWIAAIASLVGVFYAN